EAPSEIRVDHLRIEQHQGAQGAESCPDPEAAIDGEVIPAAHAGRDEFLNGGIDRGVFAANAGAGEKSKEREACDIPGERCGRSRSEVHGERNKKELLTAQAIGQPAEKNCADYCSREIGAARKSNVGV